MPKVRPVGSRGRPSLAAIKIVRLNLPWLQQMHSDLGIELRRYRTVSTVAEPLRQARKQIALAIKASRAVTAAGG